MLNRLVSSPQQIDEKPIIHKSSTLEITRSLTQARKLLVLSNIKNELIKYYDDLNPKSDYIADVEAVVSDAEKYLDKRVKENKQSELPEKLGMVLDIDDTSLSNYPSLKNDDFSNSAVVIDARYHAANAPAIPPVLRLYQEAMDYGVSVFFVSVRKPLENKLNEDLRPYAEKNLEKAGYTKWSGLFMPQGDELKMSSKDYKTTIRKNLTEKGYKLILNVGDQETDIDGGYAEHTDKLPNYIYSTSLSSK